MENDVHVGQRNAMIIAEALKELQVMCRELHSMIKAQEQTTASLFARIEELERASGRQRAALFGHGPTVRTPHGDHG